MTAARTLPITPYVTIFTMDVKAERREDFLTAMDAVMAESAKEPGIRSFMILTDRDNHNRFTAVDVYVDEAAYQLHLAAPHTARLITALDGVLSAPPRGTFWHALCDKSDFG